MYYIFIFTAKEICLRIASTLQDNYPEILKAIYIINGLYENLIMKIYYSTINDGEIFSIL